MLILTLATSLLLGYLQTSASATQAVQAGPSATLANSPTPTNPQQLLDVGRKVNGLTGADVQPWHLKATYEFFDNDGKSKGKGSFEEWWVSDKQYKLAYQSKDFSQTDYGTDHGILRSGNAQWPSGPSAFVFSALVDPLPPKYQIANSDPVVIDKMFGETKLRCVSMAPKTEESGYSSRIAFPSYCFSLETPILRSTSTFNDLNEVVFNRILLFHGHYLGGDIEVSRLGKKYLKIHVDVAEPLDQINAVDFQPPPGATPPPPGRIAVSAGMLASNILTKVQPVYPPSAKAKHVQGTVVLQAFLGRDGQIQYLRVLSGPAELRGAAMEAVAQWGYKPFLLNGQPVEVGTQINVVFQLDGRPALDQMTQLNEITIGVISEKTALPALPLAA